MGTKNNPGAFDCYANAAPDEPMFVLLGRDRIGGSLVRLWAAVRECMGADPKKIAEARQCATAMDAWHKDVHPYEAQIVLEWLPFDLLAAEWKRRGLPMPATPEAMPVVRDENGHWFHPDWPASATPDETSEEPTARGLGLELGWVRMENQVSSEVFAAYGESDGPDCRAWEPQPPTDDPEWFLTAIFDTEDGPTAHWCRPLPKGLWAVHVSGSDDIWAAPSADDAIAAAARFNTWYEGRADKHEYDPIMSATVIPYGGDAASHAEYVKNWPEFAGKTAAVG
jgi:hypothetical protein